jgi:general secretion pathway protein I
MAQHMKKTGSVGVNAIRALRSRHQRAQRSSGFTLLEVLVAFVIATLALGVLFQAGLVGLRAEQAASHVEQAISRARSRLTAAVHARPLISGDWQGDDGGGFAWHLRVAPIASTDVRPQYAATQSGLSTLPVTLYSVAVVVAWHEGKITRQVRLDTQQIGQGTR